MNTWFLGNIFLDKYFVVTDMQPFNDNTSQHLKIGIRAKYHDADDDFDVPVKPVDPETPSGNTDIVPPVDIDPEDPIPDKH